MAMLSANMNVMIRAVERAARDLLRDYGEIENLQASRKGTGDFVTAADKKAEQVLHYELSKARPKFGFLMEESGEIKGEDEEFRWVIDPIDGTRNFMHGLPGWCISVSLEKNGEPVYAVIYDPLHDELFRAEKGSGAFARNKRLRVSPRSHLKDALIGTWMPHVGLPEDKFNRFSRSCAAVLPILTTRSLGSPALDLAFVAAGRLDAAVLRNRPWNVSAGSLIVKEAGGYISDLGGAKNPVYGDHMFACNQEMRLELEKLLKTAYKEG